jgi:hypothetical protein
LHTQLKTQQISLSWGFRQIFECWDGFNEGWIEFESAEAGSRKGKVALEAVVETLIESR